jgi:hypothetical protein
LYFQFASLLWDYFFILSTRYATANRPVIANTASKPGSSGDVTGSSVSVGSSVVGATVAGAVGVAVAVGVASAVVVGVAVGAPMVTVTVAVFPSPSSASKVYVPSTASVVSMVALNIPSLAVGHSTSVRAANSIGPAKVEIVMVVSGSLLVTPLISSGSPTATPSAGLSYVNSGVLHYC